MRCPPCGGDCIGLWTSHALRLQNSNTSLTGGSVWLKNWSEVNGEAGGNPEVGKYLGIYFAFGIGNALLVVMQTLILWIFCSIEVSAGSSKQGFASLHAHPDMHAARQTTADSGVFLQASRKLHENMAYAIFRSPMTFFETTPSGRILNRFSRYVWSWSATLASLLSYHATISSHGANSDA